MAAKWGKDGKNSFKLVGLVGDSFLAAFALFSPRQIRRRRETSAHYPQTSSLTLQFLPTPSTSRYLHPILELELKEIAMIIYAGSWDGQIARECVKRV